MCLVFPGNPTLTAAFNVSTIKNKSFLVGRDHDKTHETAKQAIYDAFESTLSRLDNNLDPSIKEAWMIAVDYYYKPTHINDETFRFTIPSNGDNFTFPAVTKLLGQPLHAKDPLIVCKVPKELIGHFESLTTCYLDDRPSDEQLCKTYELFSPPIRDAFKYYHDYYMNRPDSPIKRFSDTCYLDPLGNWNSSISVYTADVTLDRPPPDRPPVSDSDPVRTENDTVQIYYIIYTF